MTRPKCVRKETRERERSLGGRAAAPDRHRVGLLDERLVRRVLADNQPAVEYAPGERARLAKRVAIVREARGDNRASSRRFAWCARPIATPHWLSWRTWA